MHEGDGFLLLVIHQSLTTMICHAWTLFSATTVAWFHDLRSKYLLPVCQSAACPTILCG